MLEVYIRIMANSLQHAASNLATAQCDEILLKLHSYFIAPLFFNEKGYRAIGGSKSPEST